MIYRFAITTPASPAGEIPQRTILKLGKGIIHKLDIVFPPGAQQKHHLRICDALHQVWPTNAEQYFASDGETISFREGLELNEEPYTLQAWTWCTATLHPHTLLIRIGLLRKKYIMPWLQTWTEKMLFSED